MKKISLDGYKYLVSLDPEFTAVIRKDDNSLILISDMEYSGYDHRLRVEYMSFELDVSLPFSESIVACRDQYAGGITFSIENCDSFDNAFSIFVQQSNSTDYWQVDNNTWGDVATLDFDEIFVVVQR